MFDSEDKLRAVSYDLDGAVTAALKSGGLGGVDPASVTRIVTASVRLYGALSEFRDEKVAPVDDSISPTEAVVMATALLQALDLNPFDLALWYSRA